jgi:phage/plasmid-associated DNA primase
MIGMLKGVSMDSDSPILHIQRFTDERFVSSPDSLVTLADAYWAYQVWCAERRVFARSKIWFSRELRSRGYTIKPTGNKNTTCVVGVMLDLSDDLFPD